MFKKISFLTIILSSLLFGFQLLPIVNKTNNENFNMIVQKNTQKPKQNVYMPHINSSISLSNIKRSILYTGQPIVVYAGYQDPISVKFPAYISGLEYIAGKGGIYVYKKNFDSGTQSITILRKYPLKQPNIIYVTVLGQKIPIIVKYPDKKHPADHLIYVNFPKSMFGIKETGCSSPKVVKVTSYKNLTFNTNIRAVTMIIRMITGTASQYYQEIDLSYHPKKKNGLFNFFGTKNKTKEEYLALLFKKVFKGNKNFMTAFFNNEIIPQKLYSTNFLVYLTNKRKENLTIYGVKTKWCNLSDYADKQITIDDVKLVFGKNILAAYFPFRKIPPHHCAEVYAVFYALKNNKLPPY